MQKLRPVIAVLLLAYGGYRVYPRFLPESPEQELVRLESVCAAMRGGMVKDRKTLQRAENHFTLVKRRNLRAPALQQLMLPIYAIRRRVEETEERLAVTEQRLAVLKGEP